MRRLYVAVAALALAACGKDAPAAPQVFSVAGTWNAQGAVPGRLSCSFSGSVNLSGTSDHFEGNGSLTIEGVSHSTFMTGGLTIIGMNVSGFSVHFLRIGLSNASKFAGSYSCDGSEGQWSMNRQ